MGVVAAKAASSRARSSASRAKAKRRALSARCSLSVMRAPTMTAATAGWSRTQRVATLERETPCLRAISGRRGEDALEGVPAAGGVDEAAVLGAAPVGHLARARGRRASARRGSRRRGCRRRGGARRCGRRTRSSGPAARRSRSEKETWLLASGMPSASASARWAASKLVTPMAAISPSLRRRASSCRASSQAGCSKLHQWNCSRSMRGDAEAGEAFLDAGAHHLGGHRAGLGAPFGRARGRLCRGRGGGRR